MEHKLSLMFMNLGYLKTTAKMTLFLRTSEVLREFLADRRDYFHCIQVTIINAQ